jgi:hypothetical protein
MRQTQSSSSLQVRKVEQWKQEEEGGIVRNELEWHMSSKRKVRATASSCCMLFCDRVFLGRYVLEQFQH